MKKSLSIIIPVYNVEKYLKECIESVLNQKYEFLEIILVNDGSTDKSLQICKEYLKYDKRIKLINKINGGLSSARNEGIKIASGNFIIFLDSDDYWENNSLDIIMKELDPNVDITFLSSRKFINGEVASGKFEVILKDKVYQKSRTEVLKYLSEKVKIPVSACTKIIKRELLIKNNFSFKEGSVCEDIEYTFNLFTQAKKYDFIETGFYNYRKNRVGSITNLVGEKSLKDLLTILEEWLKRVPNLQNISEVEKSYFNNFLYYQHLILIGNLNKKSKNIEDRIILLKKEIDKIKVSNPKYRFLKKINKILGYRFFRLLLSCYIKIKI